MGPADPPSAPLISGRQVGASHHCSAVVWEIMRSNILTNFTRPCNTPRNKSCNLAILRNLQGIKKHSDSHHPKAGYRSRASLPWAGGQIEVNLR